MTEYRFKDNPFLTFTRADPSGLKVHEVKTPDGVSIQAQEWGNPDGPEVLFIHGISQSHLSWLKQTRSDLSKLFRMVTYDLRGHGGSEKPLDPVLYRDPKRWADEVQAVRQHLGLKRPVLCGWSYGGRILCDYLSHYPKAELAGIHFVSATTKTGQGLFGPAVAHLERMGSEDPRTNITATRDFLRACTSEPLPKEEFEFFFSFNIMCPAKVRANMSGRRAEYGQILSKIRIPVLVTHGTEDKVVTVKVGKYTARVVKGAKASYYPGIGHLPFWEEPARFNAELSAFVQSLQKT